MRRPHISWRGYRSRGQQEVLRRLDNPEDFLTNVHSDHHDTGKIMATAPAIEMKAPEAAATPMSRNGRSAASPGAEAAEPSNKRKFVLPIVGLIALILLFWAFQKWSYGRSHQSTDNAQVDGHIVPVLAKVGGYVKTVNVNENDHVSTGQLLVQLDDADYRVRLQQAEADFAAAEATAGGG